MFPTDVFTACPVSVEVTENRADASMVHSI